MVAPLLEPTGLNFFLPWSLLEWAIGGVWTVAVAIAVWVWNLGDRVRRTEALVAQIKEDRVNERLQFQKEFDRLQGQIEKMGFSIEKLKADIFDRFNDLPSRMFIESQIQQLNERMDGVIDAKLTRRASSPR